MTKRLAANALTALGLLLSAAAGPAFAQTKLTFGTDWLAEGEQGGYWAVAMGFYKKHGLDVTIEMGGPQINGNAAVMAGLVDAQLSSGSSGALGMVQQSIPVVAVAAFFQKDPQVLISHPGMGADTLAEMTGKPIMISSGARTGYWLLLRAKFGFTDDQIRPYNFSMAPFLADKNLIQEGFVSSEPFQIERAGGVKPVVNLLADNSYSSWSTVVLVQSKMVADKPDIVKALVEASIEGWYSYMYGDPAPGDALIRATNKNMSQETIDNARKMMREYGIMDSGDSLKAGIGVMPEARWQEFLDVMAGAGLYKADLDVKKAFTNQFVGHAMPWA